MKLILYCYIQDAKQIPLDAEFCYYMVTQCKILGKKQGYCINQDATSEVQQQYPDRDHLMHLTVLNNYVFILTRLSSERAVSSPSECSAIIFAFMECLRFSLLQNAGAEDEHKKVQQMLISDQVINLK